MTSIKVKFKASTIVDHQGTLYYQIIHDRKPRMLFTEYKVHPSEWDAKRSMVCVGKDTLRTDYIALLKDKIRWEVERLGHIDRLLESRGLPYTADDVIEEFRRYQNDYSLINYMEGVIVRLRKNGKLRTSEAYRSALNSFLDFRHGEDLMLDCLTSEVMENYETWQRKRGVTSNTISFYTRVLRAVYNRAVEEGAIENRNPFRRVYTGVDKTVKRALSIETIRKIKALELSDNPPADYARDMFMLSFYLRGMSFIDMTYLKKSDLKNGQVSYCRSKTGQKLVIEWTQEMQQIVDKYPANGSTYLLPIIQITGVDERVIYHNTGYRINYHLKKIGEKIGVAEPLTLYVARHSWASAAKAKGIPVGVISEGMGHGSEKTTQIYLSELDNSVIDDANRKIMALL